MPKFTIELTTEQAERAAELAKSRDETKEATITQAAVSGIGRLFATGRYSKKTKRAAKARPAKKAARAAKAKPAKRAAKAKPAKAAAKAKPAAKAEKSNSSGDVLDIEI